MPSEVISTLLGHRRIVSTRQLLARLRRAGLVTDQLAGLGPLVGSAVRLWTLTTAGRAFIADSKTEVSTSALEADWYGGLTTRRRDPARQRDIPLLVACYRLLDLVASGLEQPVRVYAFEHPWIRCIASTDGTRMRRVRAPAAAILHTPTPEDRPSVALLLVPDLGTAPLSSYRPMLHALLESRRTGLTGVHPEAAPVLVVGVATRSSKARVQAWRALLRELARRAEDQALRARVFECPTLLGNLRHTQDTKSAAQVDEAFALVARHPLLTRPQLALLLGTSAGRIARLESELIECGWIRPISSNDLALDPTRRDRLQQLGLVELTASGQREAARRLLVPAGLARRRHGLLHTAGARRRLLRQFEHTFGANAFFVDFARVAKHVTPRGADRALIEWRSAAACARGRFRPDGYGCYERGPSQFGFFLEFDRGTERSTHYAAKLATYYQYRDSGACTRDYQNFPTLLVATTSERAEEQFAKKHTSHSSAMAACRCAFF
jgi:Replication-relaxation